MILMKNFESKFSLLYRIFITIIIGIGLYINFRFIPFHSGIVYFTLQSNILCFVFYLIYLLFVLFGVFRKNDNYYLFKGMVTSCITLTMIIYTLLVLIGDMHSYDGHLIECLFVHYVTPLLVIFDSLMFDESGKSKWYYPLVWSIPVVLYGIFYYIYVSSGGVFFNSNYAYSFLNIDKYGLLGTIANCLVLYVCFILGNYLAVYYDKYKGRKKI